jgi:hypothetical protein
VIIISTNFMVIWSAIIGIVLPALGSIILFDDGLILE